MTATIREWARAQGMEVGDRGIIPREVVEMYKQAHNIGQHVEPAESFELLEPQPEPRREVSLMSLAQWLELREELVAMIDARLRSEEAAEQIMLAGWMRPMS